MCNVAALRAIHCKVYILQTQHENINEIGNARRNDYELEWRINKLFGLFDSDGQSVGFTYLFICC